MMRNKRLSFTMLLCLIIFSLASSPQLVRCAKTVEIGVIAPDGVNDWAAIISIANDDINDYMAGKGLDYSFTYFLEDARGQAEVHLEHVKNFRSEGVNLLIGGGWSGHAQASLSYINDNDMLLLSPSSTSPLLNIPDDNLFRLCSPDDYQSSILANVIWSWGIDALIVIYKGNDWGDGLYDVISREFPAQGGAVVEGFRYPWDATDFHDMLFDVEKKATDLVDEYGHNQVGILMIDNNHEKKVNILREAKTFDTIYNLKWFSTEGTAESPPILDNVLTEAEHVKLFSPWFYMPETSSEFRSVSDRYISMTGNWLGHYYANIYDICWIYALSIFETGSVDALEIKEVLPDIAAGHEGITGNCELDENGDRVPTEYEILGVGKVNGNIEPVLYAFYDHTTKETIWDTDLITPPRKGPIEPENEPPVANANGPYSGEEGESIFFSSAGSRDPDGDIVEYRWTFGDGTHSYERNPSHTYSGPGTYTVRLSVTDNAGASDSETTTCTVTAPPTPTNQYPVAAVNGPYSGEEDSSISFSSAGSHDPDGNIVDYRWDFGDGQTSASADPSYTYEEAGAYTVTLRVTDNQGATDTATTSCTIEAAPPPDDGKGGFPWLPVVAVLVVAAVAAAYLYLQKMKTRVKVLRPVGFDVGVEPEEIPADGRSTAIITIGLLDDEGNPIEAAWDMAVTVSASGGVVVSSSEVKRDEATGAATITDSVRQAIESLLSRKEEEGGRRIPIKEGESGTEAAIVSSLEVGSVSLSVSAPGMRRRTVRVRFTEKRRYCMHCGASMSIGDRACPNPECGLTPPGGTDVKKCPNCGEVIPSQARFCSECGAGQPTQQ